MSRKKIPPLKLIYKHLPFYSNSIPVNYPSSSCLEKQPPQEGRFFPHTGLMFVPKACFVPLPRLSVQVGHVLCGAFCTKPCRSQCPLLIFKCRFYFISDISSCIMFSNICTFFYICQIVYFKEIKFPILFSFFFFLLLGVSLAYHSVFF